MTAKGLRGSFALVSGLLLSVACGDQGSPHEGGQGGTSAEPGNGGSSGENANAGSGNGGAHAQSASIQMRLAAPAEVSGGALGLLAFSAGAAQRPGLERLEYYITSVQICESMQVAGSGFDSPVGCLELYRGDHSAYAYELDADWTPLADTARANSAGFIDLLSPTARDTLSGITALGSEHVRSYHYGIITWALPIKVKATLPLGDGTFLYTHDGTTTFQTIGADSYRDYFTTPSTSLATPPAETAVVLLGNGGNYFKFQNPLSITEADIEQRREWVLDLVFNPEGIVKGFATDGFGYGNLREQGDGGVARGITVPMLDLAPVPHRASEHVVRESYRGRVTLASHAFDARIELYSVEGDPNGTVYGVDVKSLVTAESTSLPPELSKISSVVPESDGTLSFKSYNGTTIISGFQRVSQALDTTVAALRCATHENRAGAEGGAVMVVDSCPSENVDVTFTLVGKSRLDGEISLDVPAPDAGPAEQPDAGADAATDGG